MQEIDIAIIGAGPAGAVAGAMLARAGVTVHAFERSRFPRFSIGESLLPQCMDLLEEAGMLAAVQAQDCFQYKNGAAFDIRGRYAWFNFGEQFTQAWKDTLQVQRATFDQVLADEAVKQGLVVHYETTVAQVAFVGGQVELTVQDTAGTRTVRARKVLDASGFGRVLPRMLDLEKPAALPPRASLFTHVVDHIDDVDYDREKILICVHPQADDVWYWLIPFADGTASVGVVGNPDLIPWQAQDRTAALRGMLAAEPRLSGLLAQAEFDKPVGSNYGYSAAVERLYGPGYVLLGNAGDFLDPVFSSGVTIAMKSAALAVPLLLRELQGEAVDWQSEFDDVLRAGVDTFKRYVYAWYNQEFWDILLAPQQSTEVRGMVCSILAGYVWDTSNPYVQDPTGRRYRALVELCRMQGARDG